MEKFEKSLEDYRKERGGKLCITDVYSIAKTLWMFLLLDEKGFDGQYNFLDETILRW